MHTSNSPKGSPRGAVRLTFSPHFARWSVGHHDIRWHTITWVCLISVGCLFFRTSDVGEPVSPPSGVLEKMSLFGSSSKSKLATACSRSTCGTQGPPPDQATSDQATTHLSVPPGSGAATRWFGSCRVVPAVRPRWTRWTSPGTWSPLWGDPVGGPCLVVYFCSTQGSLDP